MGGARQTGELLPFVVACGSSRSSVQAASSSIGSAAPAGAAVCLERSSYGELRPLRTRWQRVRRTALSPQRDSLYHLRLRPFYPTTWRTASSPQADGPPPSIRDNGLIRTLAARRPSALVDLSNLPSVRATGSAPPRRRRPKPPWSPARRSSRSWRPRRLPPGPRASGGTCQNQEPAASGRRSRLMRLGLTRQHLAVSSAAEVIQVIRPKTDEEVVVALRRPLIPHLSRMTAKSDG